MGFTAVANTWYDVNMLRQPNVQKLSIQPIGTALSWQAQATRTSHALTIVGMGGGYDTATWFDDFYVRKYVATEPTTSISPTAYSASWSPQQTSNITINSSSALPSLYQINLNISFLPNMSSDFSDIRFTTKNSTSLDYWVESSVGGSNASVWVELLDSFNDNSTDYIFMTYGSPNLTSASNGNNTFDFFDDFSGGNLNKWSITGSPTILSGQLKITGATSWNTNYALSSTTINRPFIMEWKEQGDTSGYQGQDGYSVVPADTSPNVIIYRGDPTNDKFIVNNSAIGTLPLDANLNTYKLILNTTQGASAYRNNVVIGATTTGTLTGKQIGFNKYSTTSMYYDDVRIRKYVATEPNTNISIFEFSSPATPFVPPVPVISTVTTGNFFVNTSWTPGSGNYTDSYNVSYNGVWVNGSTATYKNTTLAAHGWHNVTVYAYNNSMGNLSATALTNNTQIPNNVPSIASNTITPLTAYTTSTLTSSPTTSDLDSDSITYTYLWYKDSISTGITTSTLTNLSLDSIYKVYVTPSDIYSSGTGTYSNEVTVIYRWDVIDVSS
jgi:hypothetical protein